VIKQIDAAARIFREWRELTHYSMVYPSEKSMAQKVGVENH
jgi:hypothetical protein